MHFENDGADRLVVRDGDVTLLEYVYAPPEPRLESPRPYAMLRSRDGVEATAYRPEDHVWHKGISLALPVVGTENFWGGPTYIHGEGYVQLPNNGAQVHRDFAITEAGSDVARVGESLDWVAESGRVILTERRTLTARVVDERTWALTWRSVLLNVTRDEIGFGSPTTKGRPNAGYAGIFWRGPDAFTGGEIVGPGGALGDAARGEAAPWLAFVAPDRAAGILMLDVSSEPNPWFARSEEYAGLNPAPFFFHETKLPAGATITLAAVVIIGDAHVASHSSTVGAELVRELRTETEKDLA